MWWEWVWKGVRVDCHGMHRHLLAGEGVWEEGLVVVVDVLLIGVETLVVEMGVSILKVRSVHALASHVVVHHVHILCHWLHGLHGLRHVLCSHEHRIDVGHRLQGGKAIHLRDNSGF